ncbi:MAG: hypothetical protein ACTHLZ_03890 [Tepidisphaeraceae bacterium]
MLHQEADRLDARPGVAIIAILESTRVWQGRSRSTVYVSSNDWIGTWRMVTIVRRPRSIKSSLQWQLDVSLGERPAATQ